MASEIKTLVVIQAVESGGASALGEPERSSEVAARHDSLVRGLLARFGGREIEKSGRFLLLFERPIEAVRWALSYQDGLRALGDEWKVPLAGRVAVHLGDTWLRENPPEHVALGAKPLELEGPARSAVGRLFFLAASGHILLTQGAFELAKRAAVGSGGETGELSWLSHGAYRFPDVEEPVEIFEVGIDGSSPLEPPPERSEIERLAAESGPEPWRPREGEAVPGRLHWTLGCRVRALGAEGARTEAWVAAHRKTRERHLLTFALNPRGADALRAEIDAYRRLQAGGGSPGDAPPSPEVPLARLLDWSLDQRPFFLETQWTDSGTLREWAAGLGGFGAIPLATRIDLAGQTAKALAAAHHAGVVHGNLDPTSVLVAAANPGKPRVLLSGFGLAAETSPLSYRGPELIAGREATVASDLYAFGVLLYRLSAGDLDRPLDPFWERDVPDDLLRHEVIALIDRSPENRPREAGRVAERLLDLENRRSRVAQVHGGHRPARTPPDAPTTRDLSRPRRWLWGILRRH